MKGQPQRYVRGHWARGARVEVEPPNPSGICRCGCGRPAPIAVQTAVALGYLRGHPTRFIRGHSGRVFLIDESYWTVEDRGHATACHIWNGAPNKRTGYCRVSTNGQTRLAHRAVWEQEHGPIPDGLDLDHLCFQRACVRPSHLEPVTRATNIRRSSTAKITLEDARLIRASSLSQAKVGALMGISQRAVSDIRRGLTWREE